MTVAEFAIAFLLVGIVLGSDLTTYYIKKGLIIL